MSKKKPDILLNNLVAQSQLFDIECLHLRFSNGVERYFERIRGRYNGSVMIVPMLDSETILLIREYSAGIHEYVLAFPKGTLENDECLITAARRELKEEVGYDSKKISILTRYSASPGYLDSMMHVCIASHLYEATAIGDEPEPMEVIPWQLKDMQALLDHPEFHEARSVAALLLVERNWRN